jgi:hypothetical protein
VTFVAALVVFAAVQDRVTASGAREYVRAQRAALAGRGTPVTIDQVVAPAVRRSVRDALAASGAVAIIGVLGAWFRFPRAGSRVPGSSPVHGSDRAHE